MNRRVTLSLFTAVVIAVSLTECASAVPYNWPIRRARYYDWNKRFVHTAYGQTMALVVPPTATLQTNWGWGVSSSRLQRLDHQFQRNYPGDGPFGVGTRTTPYWPSDTTQFGVYYVRGPW
jgi:hypothetical protein